MKQAQITRYIVRQTLLPTANYVLLNTTTMPAGSSEPEQDENPTENQNWTALILIAVVIWGTMGNILVCLSIVIETRLQNVTNYFLFSLAIADLLVCILAMPITILIEFHNGAWWHGLPLCILYVSADVFLCSVSIVHMSIISFDRYWGISRPLETRNKSTTVVALKIISCWLITVLIACPITVLALIDDKYVLRDNVCQIGNSYFKIYGSVLSFFIPFVIMAVTYAKTTKLLRQQQTALYNMGECEDNNPTQSSHINRKGNASVRLRRSTRARGIHHTRSPGKYNVEHKISKSLVVAQHNEQTAFAGGANKPCVCCYTMTVSRKQSSAPASNNCGENCALKPITVNTQKDPNTHQLLASNTNGEARATILMHGGDCSSPPAIMCHQTPSITVQQVEGAMIKEALKRLSSKASNAYSDAASELTTSNNSFRQSPLHIRNTVVFSKLQNLKRATTGLLRPLRSGWNLASEQKATKVLGVVFFCFFICWTPFFLLNILSVVCDQYNCFDIPPMLSSAFLWLGYISSTLNPIIYTTFNRQFRIAFVRILCCHCSKRKQLRKIYRPNISGRTSVELGTYYHNNKQNSIVSNGHASNSTYSEDAKISPTMTGK